MLFSLMFGADATIEVIKKADSLPTIGIEDSSIDYDERFRLIFFKSIVADLNVISLFNVDRAHRVVNFDAQTVVSANKDMSYVIRYKMFEDDNHALNIELKLIQNDSIMINKTYRISKKSMYMFISHSIAYDINKFMGEPSVEWMKRKVVFSRMVDSKKSEIVIADYTLTYQSIVIRGGFNIFPKWANKSQSEIYYSSLDGFKPTLKHLNLRTAKISNVISSDGIMICSDVSRDSKKLLLTMARDGQPDIYLYDVESKKLTRETRYSGIDVNGQFMGDDKIVFISSRLGYPNVFSKTLGDSDVEQMVYYGRSNAACSANKEYVVYKARESSKSFAKNTFNLHLISTKTDSIRRLTATGVNEYPRFSIDGDAIIFIKNYKSQSAIGIIRLHHNKNYLFPLKYGKIQAMDW